MNNETDIEVVRRQKVVAVLLNRPEKHNALTERMMVELTRLFRELGSSSDVRVIVLTGEGRSFCAGADISMMQDASSQDFAENVAGARLIYDLMETINMCPKPTICRVNGPAYGGGLGLVSCCDIAVAVDRAVFSLSEVRLGLVPAVISPFVLSKIGESRARELFLSGERFDAEYAKAIGLVHHVVGVEELDAKIADRVVGLLLAAPGAQADVKKLVHFVIHGGVEIEAIRDYTVELIARRRSSDEGREGLQSFLDKRPPRWQQ